MLTIRTITNTVAIDIIDDARGYTKDRILVYRSESTGGSSQYSAVYGDIRTPWSYGIRDTLRYALNDKATEEIIDIVYHALNPITDSVR